jgi:uncharacterized membrane protein YbhN (UPF0104 family)
MEIRTRMKRCIVALGQFAIAAGSFWLVLRKVDFEAAWSLMSKVSPGLVALLFALILTQITFLAWRLQVVAKAIGQSCRYIDCLYTVMIGAFVGQTPASVIGADAARIWYLLRGGLSLRDSASAVAIDRVLGLAALVGMVMLTDLPLILLVQDFWMRAAIVLVTLGGIGGFAVLLMLRWLPQWTQKGRLVRWLSELARLLGGVLLHRSYALTIVSLGFVGHLFSIVIIYLLFASFGARQTFVECLVLTPFPLLLSLLPISIGGWGVREGTLVAAFSLVGVAPELTLAVSITFGLILLVAGLPGGFILISAMATRSRSAA